MANVMTAADFIAAMYAGKLTRDSFSQSYYPAWLAPTGEVVSGTSHSRIATEVAGEGYVEMGNRGYMRLVPTSYGSLGVAITSSETHATEAQMSALRTIWDGIAADDGYVEIEPLSASHHVTTLTGLRKVIRDRVGMAVAQ